MFRLIHNKEELLDILKIHINNLTNLEYPKIEVHNVPVKFPCYIKIIEAESSPSDMYRTKNRNPNSIYCVICTKKIARTIVYPSKYFKKEFEKIQPNVWRCVNKQNYTNSLFDMVNIITRYYGKIFTPKINLIWPSDSEILMSNSIPSKLFLLFINTIPQQYNMVIYISIFGYALAKNLIYFEKNKIRKMEGHNLFNVKIEEEEEEDEIPF